MSFIISSIPFSNLKKQGSLYIKGNYIKNVGHILIFKGSVIPDNKNISEDLLNQIIEKGINSISKLKGNFCGIYYNVEKGKVFFFTDKFGINDLFYFFNGDSIIISDNFNEIYSTKKFTLDDINKESMLEFVIFQFPLFEKTFLSQIKLVSIGTIFEYDLSSATLKRFQYDDYRFNINHNLSIKSSIDILEKLFDNSIERIKNKNSPKTIYGLGLSGGMDSRLVAYYMMKHNMKTKTFIFGERNSDAYYISKKIAQLLKLEHYELGFKNDFYKYSEKSIEFNPMMDIIFSWYYAVYKKLPNFNILMTGFNGDNQFGSHLRKRDFFIKNELEFVNIIFDRYCELKNLKSVLRFINDKSIILKIKQEIINFSKESSNSEFWQKKEEFNFKYRQRVYIKNNPSFNFFGLFNSNSIFIDPYFMQFMMTIPFQFRLNRELYFKFFKAKLPFLLKIRPERDISLYYDNKLLRFLSIIIRHIDEKILKTNLFYKKSHKNIEEWLSKNSKFYNFLQTIFSLKNELFEKLFNTNEINKLILKEKWTSTDIALIFRFLTIKLFLDKFM